jgi:ABC-type phosphate transport system permease subunit
MPEILTMIQIKKLTPTPAVLCMVGVTCFLFMFSPNKMLYNHKTITTQITIKFCPLNVKQINSALSAKLLVLFVLVSVTLFLMLAVYKPHCH